MLPFTCGTQVQLIPLAVLAVAPLHVSEQSAKASEPGIQYNSAAIVNILNYICDIMSAPCKYTDHFVRYNRSLM